jgi:hypothetical protein
MTTYVDIEGVKDAAEYFKHLPDLTKRAARLAINTVINRGGMKAIKDQMYREINFPKGYLNGDRLRVSKLAKEEDLEGIIVGRKRATSLARFVAPGTPLGSARGRTVKVTVRNGGATYLRNAWLVRLKAGAKSITEDNFNIGLAVRVRPGDSLKGKKTAHQAWLNQAHTVALLYGPSVDQVFRDVAEDTGPTVLKLVSVEFLRQFERLS